MMQITRQAVGSPKESQSLVWTIFTSVKLPILQEFKQNHRFDRSFVNNVMV